MNTKENGDMLNLRTVVERIEKGEDLFFDVHSSIVFGEVVANKQVHSLLNRLYFMDSEEIMDLALKYDTLDNPVGTNLRRILIEAWYIKAKNK